MLREGKLDDREIEIEVAAVADTTIVVLNPGTGDAVQAAKAGLLEVADIVVVNKADGELAPAATRTATASPFFGKQMEGGSDEGYC